jgi:hypothetical protein
MIVESDRIQFGDFQTPPALAALVVDLLRRQGLAPRTIVEPTCGTGAFTHAGSTTFPDSAVLGYDINPDYVRTAAALDRRSGAPRRLTCQVGNFFELNWAAILAPLAEPILILGNPPWATSSGLGALGSRNLPQKSNFQNRRGLDARTGKSNFDVAESMLLTLLDAGRHKNATLAMLVKTSVARRVLSGLWTIGAAVEEAAMYRFDASSCFGVSAEACLFVCQLGARRAFECVVADLERPDVSLGRVGWRDGTLVSDPVAYDRHRSLIALTHANVPFRWRSGVKHDCAAIMELREAAGGIPLDNSLVLRPPGSTAARESADSSGKRRCQHHQHKRVLGLVNGIGHRVEIEPDYVYPLLKGTDLAHGRVDRVRRWLLVTQTSPGEDTSVIARCAPQTWAYLSAHGERLDARRSSIYRSRPRFSVFGVGPYTFAPWKVAISALHKRLSFAVVGPLDGRPVVLDDTCYHLSFEREAEARLIARLLNSDLSRELLGALMFWDAKRPITSQALQRLDLERLAIDLGRFAEWAGTFLASSGQPAVR